KMSWVCNKYSWKICETLNKYTDKCSGCGLMVKNEDKKIISRSAGKQWCCPKILLEESGTKNDRLDKQSLKFIDRYNNYSIFYSNK
ncbi:5693_t:CDS:2, partial [Cetraspora pellucida]